MDTMAANIRLHLVVGLILLFAYLATLLDHLVLGRQPFLW